MGTEAMWTITEAQWSAWISAYFFPAVRILSLLAVAPVFSNRALPTRIRLVLGLAITVAIAPVLPPAPPIPLDSWLIYPIIAQELLIGITCGFVLRFIFAAIDLAAAMVGFQMGLSFAVFYSPTSGTQTPVLNEFFAVVATLLFLALDGHLMLLNAIVVSFDWLPLGAGLALQEGMAVMLHYPVTLFAFAFLLSLPITAVVLLTNIALAILTRTAPQLNLFAIGFPITITMGFLALLASLSPMGGILQQGFAEGIEAVGQVIQGFSGR